MEDANLREVDCAKLTAQSLRHKLTENSEHVSG